MALGAAQNNARPAPPAPVAVPSAKTPRVSYHEAIAPIFKADCTGCHSKEAPGGGLALDSVEGLRKGGAKFGAKIIVPGNPKASLLIAYLRGAKQPRMPLGRPALSEAQVRKVEAWIAQGAVVDTEKLGFPYTPPPATVPVPKVKSAAWTINDIDRFVLAKLEANGLKPSPPASKSILLRRVYLDLVGMPPTPEEADNFYADTAPGAYDRLVDRLLNDPRYGERWGRHWLDLVRYADTHGFEADNIRPRAWRFRDYVIRAFNADKPYDRFLKEQVAGDELFPGDPDALIATGFARLGPWDELSADQVQRWQDYLNDVTDTTGAVMLGMTVGCARCHDHKYDKIGIADYYRLQAFYSTTTWRDLPLPEDTDPVAYREKVKETQTKIATLRDQAKKTVDKPEMEKLNNEVGDLERDIAPIEPFAEGITDEGPKAKPQHILLRGSLGTPGPKVEPGFVAALCGGVEKPASITQPATGKTTGRRSALANWIASPDNPMTARVMMNRLWQHHFGQGIVRTPSDFGRNGDKPSHPELLDWLARKFIAEGWSLKKMHRLMLTSAAYRQSITQNPLAMKKDRANHLLWRTNRIRLEGEALRDSILCVSGGLNLEQGGPGIYPKISGEVLSTGSTHKWGNSPEDQQRRRSVYVVQRRSLGLPLVEVFDGPDMINTCPRRNQTTIAPQALALFNGEFSQTEAARFANRVIKEAGTEGEARIVRAYRIAFCRRPTTAEIANAKAYLKRKVAMYAADKVKPVDAESRSLADFCHILINANEFIYLD
jgi:mono/diheme cytochrome c family protein